MVGRKKIELTREDIISAVKICKKQRGKLIQGDVAKILGVSYPVYLREKEKLGLDPKTVLLTPKDPRIELPEYTEEEMDKYIEELEEKKVPTGYEEIEYKFDESIILSFISDTHIGSRTSEYERFWRYIKDIKKTSNTKTLFLADLIDNFGKNSPGGGVHDQIISISSQEYMAKWMFKYLGKEKILGLVHGSHEEFSHRDRGIDFSKQLANSIGVPYLGFGGIVKMHVGENEYKIYIAHEDHYYSKYNLCHGLKRICREELDFDLGVSAHRHVGDMEYFEVKGEPKRAMKLSGYKDPDRFLEKKRYFKKPTFNMCAVLLAEKQKYKNHGIVLFEDFDHAKRFL